MNDKLKIFLEFVELKTKIASFFPMIIGFFWASYYFNHFNFLNSLLFFIAALLFDMCTTAINNTMDYVKAVDNTYKRKGNVIGREGLSLRWASLVIFSLLALSLLFSISLVLRTDKMLIFMGGVCFFIGIVYTFGPVPISRTPFGELFSGITMGFGIVYLAIYASNFQNLLTSEWTGQAVSVMFNWGNFFKIFWMSFPLVCLTSNIMLANNLRDLETDIKNERYTLVYYLGRKQSENLYLFLGLLAWLSFGSFIFIGWLPWWCLIAFLGLPFSLKKIYQLTQHSEDPKLFFNTIQNYIILAGLYVILMGLVTLFKS